MDVTEDKKINLFLAPHNDDEALFGAFTIMRENCHVIICTDSWIQFNRGQADITAEVRWQETCNACYILRCPVLRLGQRDDTVTDESLAIALERFVPIANKVYAPAIQHGNIHHDMVSRVAQQLFGDKVIQYTTYTPTVLHTVGNIEVIPTPEETLIKNRALECYVTQMRINRPHFDAVFGKTEWLM